MSENTKSNDVEAVNENRPRREITPVRSAIPMLDTARFEHMGRIATMMASSSLIPEHIRSQDPKQTVGNCFLIINQADRWGMDPFSLMCGSYFVHGKLGFEGKVIAAAINSDPEIDEQLEFEYFGKEGTEERGIKVTGKLRRHKAPVSIKGTVKQWRTHDKNGNVNAAWRTDPDQMLAYRGARTWARLHNPERILGIYSADELDDMRAEAAKDITYRSVEITQPKAAPSGPPSAAPEEEPQEENTVEAAETAAPAEVVVDDNGEPELPANLDKRPKGEDQATADDHLQMALDDLADCEGLEEIAEWEDTYAPLLNDADSDDQKTAEMALAARKRFFTGEAA